MAIDESEERRLLAPTPALSQNVTPGTTLALMPFSRGINSIQLVKLGPRWWVASIMWDAERAGVTIPAAYLGRSHCLRNR
jgi:hypothetical protein